MKSLYEHKHVGKGNKPPSSKNYMKFVFLLILIGTATPVFAQEPSFDDQLVNSAEYSKVTQRLYELENQDKQEESITPIWIIAIATIIASFTAVMSFIRQNKNAEHLDTLKNYNEILRNWILVYNEHKTEKQKSDIIFSAERLGETCNHFIQRLKEHIPKVENLFSDPTLGTHLIGQSNSFSSLFFNMKEDYVWQNDSIEQIHAIENTIELLSKGVKRIHAEIPKVTEQS